MLLSEAIEIFVYEKRSEGVTEKTVSHYYQDIGYFIKFVEDKDIKELNKKDIIDYRIYLLAKEKNSNHKYKTSGGRLSKVTINTYLRTLRTFVNWMIEYEMISKIKIKLLKEPKRILEVLEDNDIAIIIEMSEKGWVQQRNKLMLYMFIDSGLRKQEVLNLKIRNVDLLNNIIRIKNSKGAKDRNVPMGKLTKKLFIKYMDNRPLSEENDDYVFITVSRQPMTENSMKMVLYRIKEKYGFEKFNAHYLRHTFATKYLINQYETVGVADIEQLREILGHESLRVTRNYLHVANQYLIKTQQFGVLSNVQKKKKIKKRPTVVPINRDF